MNSNTNNKNHSANDSQEKITNNIYELRYFNNKGLLNVSKIKTHMIGLFILIILVSQISLFIIGYIKNNDIPILVVFSFEFLDMVFYKLLLFYSDIVKGIFSFNEYMPQYLINQAIVSTIISTSITLLFLYKINKRSKFQAALSSVGLSHYYYDKKKNRTIYLKFKKGQKNSFKTFISEKDNLSQMLGYPNIQFKRWLDNGLMIQYTNKFPTIEELSKLNIKNFLKEDKLFLGIGLPQIGEKYNKKDLIDKKYLPRYIDFTDIPQGVANLGSAGGGKSNTMNQYLYSIFNNFDKVHSFYFVDFKGGIEAQPILDLEDRYQTNKIKIFDDNRIELYKTLKLLYFINKARMRYLKMNKLKKFTSDFIILLFDELAEILDFKPNTKEDKFIQTQISSYIETLLRTGRSQGFKIIYSTQSYLSTSSGLTSGMKNNTKLKIMHQLGSGLQVGSVKPTEELNEIGINPTSYDVGKNVVINESNNTIFEVRSLFIPDDFIDTVEINNKMNTKLETELKEYYKATYYQLQDELKSTKQEDDTIYSLLDIAKDLSINIDTNNAIQKMNTTPNTPLTPTIKTIDTTNTIPKSNIFKKIELKPYNKTTTESVSKSISKQTIKKGSTIKKNKTKSKSLIDKINATKISVVHKSELEKYIINYNKDIDELKQKVDKLNKLKVKHSQSEQDIEEFLSSLK